MHLTTTWVIKFSKFCNMRCKYCYEWNELADRSRMPMALWEKILTAVVGHHALWQARIDGQWRGVEHRSLIVLHGGEPLALPTEYLAQALTLFDQMRQRAAGTYQLSVQSNLLSVAREKIDLLLDRGAQLSVSFDLCEYLGACNGSPLYSSRVTTPYAGLCPSAHACISFMIDYVKEQGYGPAEIRALLDRIRGLSP
jgi:MoaA/NifB/PqqE/SkfB family radical SAM enzyme